MLWCSFKAVKVFDVINIYFSGYKTFQKLCIVGTKKKKTIHTSILTKHLLDTKNTIIFAVICIAQIIVLIQIYYFVINGNCIPSETHSRWQNLVSAVFMFVETLNISDGSNISFSGPQAFRKLCALGHLKKYRQDY